MDNLKPSQKALLQEVADLMLEIYQTLARMQYLDPSWINEGPHNIDALLAMYQSYNLDASVIYLYSILPYIDTAGAEEVKFFQGCEFADFRKERDVKQGRDPFYADSEEETMRPWMTPLSLLGNHGIVILYDSRKNLIGIYDQESGGSADANLYKPWSTGALQETNDDEQMTEEENSDEENSDEGLSEEVGEDNEEEEEEEDDDGGNIYDEMDGRLAADVLHDIIQWHHDLTECPGGGEFFGGEWDAEIVKSLYRKHGWPEAIFDGEAFLVDRARAKAAESAKYSSEEPLREIQAYGGSWNEDDDPAMKQIRARLAAAKTEDEEWLARWQLWHMDLVNSRGSKRARRAKGALDQLGGQCQKPEELPLWEERQLREESWEKERTLKKILQVGQEEKEPGYEIRLHYAEKQAEIYQKAHEASKLDAERLCPGKSLFAVGQGVEILGLDLEARIEDLTGYIEAIKPEVKSMQEWITQLPDSAHQARQAAQSALAQDEQFLEAYMQQRSGCVLELEKAMSRGT